MQQTLDEFGNSLSNGLMRDTVLARSTRAAGRALLREYMVIRTRFINLGVLHNGFLFTNQSDLDTCAELFQEPVAQEGD
jgi:hypothetical protein